jgi:hypothetical protein
MGRDDRNSVQVSDLRSGTRVDAADLSRVATPRADRVARLALSGPLSVALGGLCAYQLLTWVPHYLTWPWFSDHDVFATLAFGWEHGQLPYRDLAANNFPGTVYLFWLIGKLFGWGRTMPLFAVDAAFVVTLGALLLCWSRRRLGSSLPGLAGYAIFLTYYLSLNFTLVAQRDWHGPFFLVAGVLLVEAFPGRSSRVISAMTTATAFAIRPQVVLLVPAMVLALAESVRETEGQAAEPAATGGVLARWSLLVGVLVGLAFLPLLLAGILGDFLRGVGLTFYGASYNQVGPRSIVSQMLLQMFHLEFDFVPVALLLLAPLADVRTRATARVWLVAYAGALFYKPLSPVPFPYLEHALRLVWAVNMAVLIRILALPALARPAIRLVAVSLAVLIGVRFKPLECSLAHARQALAASLAGRDLAEPPLGLRIEMPLDSEALAFPWNDYREMLAYLRTRTRPGTWVANLIHLVPAVNGPCARRTPLPAESLAWLAVRPHDEPAFARAIERAPEDSLVVWSPQPGRIGDLYAHEKEVRRLAPLICRHFEPAARFGDIEVWRRKGAWGRPGPTGLEAHHGTVRDRGRREQPL